MTCALWHFHSKNNFPVRQFDTFWSFWLRGEKVIHGKFALHIHYILFINSTVTKLNKFAKYIKQQTNWRFRSIQCLRRRIKSNCNQSLIVAHAGNVKMSTNFINSSKNADILYEWSPRYKNMLKALGRAAGAIVYIQFACNSFC